MKAVQFDRLGGAEVLEWRDVPKPELLPGTILIKNQVITVNFGDTLFFAASTW